MLNFDLAIPSALTFANLFSKMSESEERTSHLAQYLCELTLMDGETYLVRAIEINLIKPCQDLLTLLRFEGLVTG